RLLHVYLDALFDKDPKAGAAFHELQVGLYADFDYPKLLNFLEQSSNYRLDVALKVCEQRRLYPEMVFVLGRMPQPQALALLLEQIRDVPQARPLDTLSREEELWESLISHCLSRPDLVAPLLNDIGAHVDPVKVVKRIPLGMRIEGLREKIKKIISDYHLHMCFPHPLEDEGRTI
ncbi:hypothetical protein T484DRAFT_1613013, partial [Baffinella frigidus]